MAPEGQKKDRIILGLMNYGPDPAHGGRVRELDEFVEHLDYFKAQGYDEIDTSRGYMGGKQEEWTQKAGWKEKGFNVATKHYPIPSGQHKAAPLRAAVELSLRELQTDQVDIYYLHAPDRGTPFKETVRVVNELYKEGKFRPPVEMTQFLVQHLGAWMHRRSYVKEVRM